MTSTLDGEQPLEVDPRSAGDRIEQLLTAADAAGPAARERAEDLVRCVLDLYGAGLERLLEIVHDSGGLSEESLERLADDPLVSSLLLVHGLHPYGLDERVARALDGVRPYLGSHGGDVELLEVTDDGVVRLRMLGSCDGCPSSAVTLQLAVEGAITAAAPEVVAVEVVATPSQPDRAVIPMTDLTARLRTAESSGGTWTAVTGADTLRDGATMAATVGGLDLVLCRVAGDTYAYRSRCPGCGASLSGATVQRRVGGPAGATVLTCPGCRRHFDARRAGTGLDDPTLHLEPMPLLERAGSVEVAIPAPVTSGGPG